MQLTGKQIVERNIIQNYDEENAVQQQGIDVRVFRIGKVIEGEVGLLSKPFGFIPAVGKTKLPVTKWYEQFELADEGALIQPGYYEIEFFEGCRIPNNCAMYFKTRSSVIRCGAEVRSGQFDAGFETTRMGAYFKVEIPIVIEYGARLAQVIINETAESESTYNGQFQGDKQRK
jgi:deoxycytidine triphosphate deaminase